MEDVNLSDLKVMVIDDSNTIRRAADVLLKKTGCTIINKHEPSATASEKNSTQKK